MNKANMTQAEFIAAVQKMLDTVDMAPVRRFELEHILRCWRARETPPQYDKGLRPTSIQTKAQ